MCSGPNGQSLNTAVTLDYGQSYTAEFDQLNAQTLQPTGNFISWTLTHVGPGNYSWSVNDDGVNQSGSF